MARIRIAYNDEETTLALALYLLLLCPVFIQIIRRFILVLIFLLQAFSLSANALDAQSLDSTATKKPIEICRNILDLEPSLEPDNKIWINRNDPSKETYSLNDDALSYTNAFKAFARYPIWLTAFGFDYRETRTFLATHSLNVAVIKYWQGKPPFLFKDFKGTKFSPRNTIEALSNSRVLRATAGFEFEHDRVEDHILGELALTPTLFKKYQQKAVANLRLQDYIESLPHDLNRLGRFEVLLIRNTDQLIERADYDWDIFTAKIGRDIVNSRSPMELYTNLKSALTWLERLEPHPVDRLEYGAYGEPRSSADPALIPKWKGLYKMVDDLDLAPLTKEEIEIEAQKMVFAITGQKPWEQAPH